MKSGIINRIRGMKVITCIELTTAHSFLSEPPIAALTVTVMINAAIVVEATISPAI